MGPTDERIDVNTSAAVRSGSGFTFGTVKWLHAGRLLVEIDAEYQAGEEVELRITLHPSSGTALVRGHVQRPLVTARDELPRYVVTVGEVAPEDRARMAAWIHNLRNRGTLSNFDTVSTSTSFGRPMTQTSSSEVRAALQRLSQRGTSRPSGTSTSPPAEDPFGLRSDVNTGGGARAAMRDALRRAVATPPAARPTPSASYAAPPSAPTPSASYAAPPSARPTPSALPGSRPAAPASPGAAPGAVPRTAPRPNAEPTYASTQTRTAAWLEVRWEIPEHFARDARAYLADPLLLLPYLGQPLPDRDPVRVMLRHDQLCVECGAKVMAHGEWGASYRLAFDEGHRGMLTAWLKGFGR